MPLAVTAWMRERVLQDYPDAEQLHEELQCSACLALDGQASSAATAPLEVWRAVTRQTRRLADVEHSLAAAREQAGRDAQARLALSAQMEEQRRALTAGEALRAAQQAESERLHARLVRSEDLAREVPRLMEQLACVQEALSLAQGAANDARDMLQQREVELSSLRERGAELEARLEALNAVVHARDRSLAELTGELSGERARANDLACENDALLSQLATVQMALEEACARAALGAPSTAESSTPGTTPILPGVANVAASDRRAPLGAAERVRAQLSYRLGACMIQSSRTPAGWVKMPFRLVAISLAFRRERGTRAPLKQVPIHAYRDAHEADRVRQHLSYRLGQTLIKQVSTPIGWFGLPSALYRELVQFRSLRRT